jgi:hypothetical protein
MILTKQANSFDPDGQSDKEDITVLYKSKEGNVMLLVWIQFDFASFLHAKFK